MKHLMVAGNIQRNKMRATAASLYQAKWLQQTSNSRWQERE